jgi:hypothetical protein
MRVIMGGVASHHELPLDRLDDVQLAVETILAEEPGTGGRFVLVLSVATDGLNVRLEGLENQRLKAALLSTDPFRPSEACRLDVRLFLDALVDDYRVLESSGGSFAVEMEKRAS